MQDLGTVDYSVGKQRTISVYFVANLFVPCEISLSDGLCSLLALSRLSCQSHSHKDQLQQLQRYSPQDLEFMSNITGKKKKAMKKKKSPFYLGKKIIFNLQHSFAVFVM